MRLHVLLAQQIKQKQVNGGEKPSTCKAIIWHLEIVHNLLMLLAGVFTRGEQLHRFLKWICRGKHQWFAHPFLSMAENDRIACAYFSEGLYW